jgi:hypothetical protein
MKQKIIRAKVEKIIDTSKILKKLGVDDEV